MVLGCARHNSFTLLYIKYFKIKILIIIPRLCFSKLQNQNIEIYLYIFKFFSIPILSKLPTLKTYDYDIRRLFTKK